MAWTVEPDPLQPEEALAWFRARLPLPDPEFRALREEARRRAFWVSGLAALDMVQEVMDALEAALREGTTFGDFQKALSERVKSAWGEGSRHRLEAVFRTNLQLAYGAGRWKEAVSTRELRPYWGLSVVLDGRTSEVCRPLAGVVLPADDPFWRTHIPPLHYNCRTVLVTYAREEGERRAWREPPAHEPQPGFGRPPTEDEWSPDPKDYHPELWGAYLRALGRGMPEADRYLAGLLATRQPRATDWMLAAGRVAVAGFPEREERVKDPRVRSLLGPMAQRIVQKLTKHAVIDEQFRPNLTPEEYLEALRSAAVHPEAAFVVHAPPRGPALLVIAPSEAAGDALGPNALPWLVVVYDLRHGTLVTGYQASSLEEVTLWDNHLWLRKNPRLF
ncbi:phage head morphogenesis protein [Thermus aquaticus]|uniref:Phage (Mu-like) virion head morphogenesis protein n=1 Tax=Thermus aquaticus (strain ATCC BAA-2747 / Y51MC23) TaxID=498848 RepID=A0ABM5VLL7_THEA5|nr:phage minor head protein [Thermus aquaticus]ALJ91027.1 phage (Mu-like) virion head morphogenesis protein [Thermus aquaticus Y51MC23]